MLPLRAETLSLWDIAEHCARELGGRRSEVEICNELEQSWLRGDLQCTRPELRLSFLRALHRAQDGRHYFFVSGDDPEPNRAAGFEDGSCQVDLRLAIPIPSHDPDHWTLENCAKAFDILGSDWKEELAPDIVRPTIGAVIMTQKNFIDYTKARGYDEISFWATPRLDTAFVDPADPKPRIRPKRLKSPDEAKRLVKRWLADGTLRRPSVRNVEKRLRDAGYQGGLRPLVERVVRAMKAEGGLPKHPGRPRVKT